MNDLKYALRMLSKRPGGNVIVILTLALLLGALSLALGTAQHHRKQWTPFHDSDRLVRLWRMGKGRPYNNFPREVLLALQQNCEGLEQVGGIGGPRQVTLTGEGEPRRLTGTRVSASVLEAAGIAPRLGRIFTAEEEQSAEAPPVLLSESTWQTAFDADPDVVGRPVTIDNVQHWVAGVMPEHAAHNALFFFGQGLWLPGNFERATDENRWLEIVGRLKPGIERSQLNAELAVLVPPVEKAYAAKHDLEDPIPKAEAYPIDKMFSRTDADEVFIVAVIPLMVLLIAGFNIANVLLARMIARRKELAMRSALGAPRRRLVRQLLIESVVLALVAGAVGMVGAAWISKLTAAQGIPAEFSPLVIGAVLVIAMVIGALVGVIPALRATGGNLNHYLKEGASVGVQRHRLRNFLVGGQVAMAAMLCITAALFLQSYLNKKSFDPGFDTAKVLEMPISPRKDVYDNLAKRRLYAERVVRNLRSVSGVGQVAVSTDSPVGRYPFPTSIQFADNFGKGAPYEMIRATAVSPEYFGMVGMTLLQGRSIEERDRGGADRVAVVNRTFAQRYFPNANPIGNRIRLPIEGRPPWVTIVGVTADRPNVGRQPDFGPEVILSFAQTAPRWTSYRFLVRTEAPPGSLKKALRRAARAVDANQPLRDPALVQSRLERAVEWDVDAVKGISVIGVFGLLIAILGVYGVVSNAVAERTHEIGIRMALGSAKAGALRLILRQGMRPVLIGLVAGFGLAAGTTFAISQMLFGISPVDLPTYLFVGAVFAVTALIASLVPASRATRIDPMKALRYE